MEFCVRNKFFLSSTNFEKASYTTHIHAATKNEWTIDHCLISSKCKKFLVDGGVDQSAECFTDHFLVLMKVKFNSTVVKKFFKKSIPKLDFSALQLDAELRLKVGKKMDELIEIQQSAGVVVTFQMCMEIVKSVCKLLLPVIPRKVNSK